MWLMRTAFKICFPPSGVEAVARDIVKTVDNGVASGLVSPCTSGTASSLVTVAPTPTPKPVTHNWFLLAFWGLIAVFSFSFTYGIPLGVLIAIGLATYFKVTSKQQAKSAAAAEPRTPSLAPPPVPASPSGSNAEVKLPAMNVARVVSTTTVATPQPPHPGVPAG